jgi:hypothetical protein
MSSRTHHAALLRLVLDAIDVEDQIERTACLDGIAAQRFEEPVFNPIGVLGKREFPLPHLPSERRGRRSRPPPAR